MERRLTAQEREVLRLHGAGLTPPEIARTLEIGEMTVAWIVANLVAERGARRTEELARALAAPPPTSNLVTQLALSVAVLFVLVGAATLAATGTLHGPLVAPARSANASPTTQAPNGSTSASLAPTANPPAADADARTFAPTAPPAAPSFAPAIPTRLPVVPSLVPVAPTSLPMPTVVPSLPVPLPPLPTVPPLPTPRLPLEPPLNAP